MKVWKIIGIPLMVLILILAVTACGTADNQTYTPAQGVQVMRGDLITRVNGTGRTIVANDARLSFGSGGKLAILNVKEGDVVSKGDVLAQLDTGVLELAVTQAEVAVTQGEVAVTQAGTGVIQAETGLKSAELALENAQDVYINADVVAARQVVTAAKANLDYAKDQQLKAVTSYDKTFWEHQVETAEDRLRAAEANLNNLLSTPDPEEVAIKRLQVTSANQTLVQSQQSLALAQQSLTLAQQSMRETQKQLDEATITAPFDGIIANLYFKQGDIIPSPTLSPQITMYLVDTSNMETDVNIDEMDVLSVQAGQKAIISLDVLPGITLSGTVTSVATVPKTQLAAIGATVYVAKVNFTVPQGLAIKVGMNASVDIVTNEHKNILFLPNDAIKKDNQGESYVEIMNDQQIVTKPVVIGLSNGTQTEIVSGLNEGDKVMTAITAGKWSLQ